MRRQMALGLVLVGLSVGWARRARADDADALIEQGLALREHAQDAEALEVFERAFRTTPSPRAKAQIALAEQALGRWVAAEKDLTAALSADADPWIAKYKGALDGSLATVRTHLGDLLINGGVTGAEVKVDGVAKAVLPPPGPLRLVVGTHTLEVRAEGYYPFSQPVTIRADAPAAVSVEMHVEPALLTTRSASGPKPEVVALPRPTEPVPPRLQRTIGIVLAVSSIAPLAVGFVALGARESEVSAYNADATCPGLQASTQPVNCQSHVDAAGAWQAVSIVGFVAAGVLAVTGIVVALIAPHRRSSIAVMPWVPGLTARW